MRRLRLPSASSYRRSSTPLPGHIREEQARGRIGALPDVDETARALIWLDERYLSEALGRTRQAEPQLVAAVLYKIWTSTLYGTIATEPR